MQKITVLISEFWRQILIFACVLAVLGTLLLLHLGTQPPALSAPEVAARVASSSLRAIWNHPLNAPFLIPQHFIVHLMPTSVAASRLVAVAYGALSLALLFIILRFWHGIFAAAIGTALCATSSWFLASARLGEPQILLLGVLGLITGGLWLKHTIRRNTVLIIGAVIVGITLYIPGMIWFMVAAAIWQRKTIAHELKHVKRLAIVAATVIFLILAVPLIYALWRQPVQVYSFLGLPSHWPHIHNLLLNLYHIPSTLFFWAPTNPIHWLGNLPMLDIFGDAMFALGVYSFWKGRKLGRSKYLLGASIVGVILVTVGGPVTILVLLPAVFITIAVGVLYMWETWLSVFPHNPLARTVGLIFLIGAVIISCNYQLRRYFIAWPHAPATNQVFVYKPTGFDTISTLRKE